MILDHKCLNLFDKMLFEKATLQTPFKRGVPMPNEACFIYILDGQLISTSEKEQMVVDKKDGLLMKCGHYFGNFFGSGTSQKYEAVAVHFYPEILNKVYANEIPGFLKDKKKIQSSKGMTKVKADEMLAHAGQIGLKGIEQLSLTKNVA